MADLPGDAVTMNQLLVRLNQLTLKAFSARSKRALIFIMLNDTRKMVVYDRATLWDITSAQPSYLGTSGQTAPDVNSPLVHALQTQISSLGDLSQMQVISLNTIPGSTQVLESREGVATAIWLPMTTSEQPSIGLLLERWQPYSWTADEMKVLTFVRQGYGEAWRHYHSWMYRLRKMRKTVLFAAVALLVLLFLIPVPLRIVAPCEVVAESPYLITAPLDGIIDHVTVHPGEELKKGTLLFSYDKKVPLEELAAASKAVAVSEAQLRRALTVGWSDSKLLNDAAVYKLELEKERVTYALAKYHADRLDVTSPIDGVAIFDDPDRWRGKPVTIGEPIMVVADPHQTKVRFWIPEADKVAIDSHKPIKIYLNVSPAWSYEATILYIGDYSVMTEKGVSSFTGEAEWVSQPSDAKLGLKGSVILYGERVSIFYFLMRKPWNYLRDLTGF